MFFYKSYSFLDAPFLFKTIEREEKIKLIYVVCNDKLPGSSLNKTNLLVKELKQNNILDQ